MSRAQFLGLAWVLLSFFLVFGSRLSTLTVPKHCWQLLAFGDTLTFAKTFGVAAGAGGCLSGGSVLELPRCQESYPDR